MSERVAVHNDDIEEAKELAFDNTQTYKINNYDILLLNHNGSQVKDPKCKISEVNIINSKYKFCSIKCKLDSIALHFSLKINRRKKNTLERSPLC